MNLKLIIYEINDDDHHDVLHYDVLHRDDVLHCDVRHDVRHDDPHDDPHDGHRDDFRDSILDLHDGHDFHDGLQIQGSHSDLDDCYIHYYNLK